ncbi:2-C-methyl-D-erythritol 4-phosphate cytidylyltransferase [Noviherbaspirillum sp. UKPF54]|uniref:2-C-methyl-D-erythritol 4-phosphate cytidylyltransferase n=1 Tax=Noviherbaspirillum sp. UKPF54 TaxID=2601898 RepID=UPI0011B1BC8B|nr:2-C-methyl-D-erythritol 4-phosphate cytidylyltransferase [Noviherbaspirillum sp. UKPF54]QDZ27569.1 2-C-methyl-D-erythritol 4-phosphate cytidylyltransferase [Noviherbaspirillum sp. UKPF54]
MISPRYFALIPAAGVGARMRAGCPKQYMPLAGKPMLRHVLDTFAATPEIAHTYVVVSAEDGYIADVLSGARHLFDRISVIYNGGATRHQSVLNGLRAIGGHVGEDDWVLVHDAARPGLTGELIGKLARELRDDAVGGLLALPVVDTLKRSDGERRAQATVSREHLWAAQTPQMFRYALLRRALEEADEVTDEASAVEALGLQPKLVEGSPRNLKVTLPHDVALAELYLKGIA